MGLFGKLRRPRQIEAGYQAGQLAVWPPVLQPAPAQGFAVVDLETTGLAAGRDRIVEVAVIRTDPWGRVLDEWTTLINPDCPVGATHIHQITAADVRQAPRFADMVGELNTRLAGRALVAHNARFDLSFLQTEYARSGWQMPVVPVLCTLEASWVYLPHLARRRLPDCCNASGIDPSNAHTALGDARATASLLASYLNPNGVRSPTHEHLQLPIAAALVAWPPIPPLPSAAVALRHPSRPAAVPAPPGTLATLLDSLPVSSMIDEGAPADATVYLELLAEVLEDGILTEAEAASLADLATVYRLGRNQTHAAHRGFLLALAYQALEDGKITRDERGELLAIAALLGFGDGIVKTVLDEARAASHLQHAAATRPLPGGWPHGEPLYIGQGVAFTGGDGIERARLEGRARAAGLRVTGAVSRKTAVLVTDGTGPHTTKATAAREYGTRVVGPAVFAQLVDHIQPPPTTDTVDQSSPVRHY